MSAMKFRTELTYDASPPDVFAMLRDAAFRERVCEAQEVVSAEVTVTPAGDGFDLTVEQVQRTAGLPAIAKKFAGETTEVVVTESWATPDGGTVDVSAPGKPTTVRGSVRLRAEGPGTVEMVELDVKVKVPLIGGKLEQLLVDQLENGYAVEHAVGIDWLAGKR